MNGVPHLTRDSTPRSTQEKHRSPGNTRVRCHLHLPGGRCLLLIEAQASSLALGALADNGQAGARLRAFPQAGGLEPATVIDILAENMPPIIFFLGI